MSFYKTNETFIFPIISLTKDGNRPGRPTWTYGLAYDMLDQTFFLNRECLDFFRSLFNLKGQASCHSKSLLGLLGQSI
ncbi:hypothetical protein MTR_4g021280 [Medicago truncatula]|uniref:Uncharacterized protein n=1 Tax=Medicago truncatula TaxID=3880 RepID=G7JTD8_MEDTR|nr:hypothetical protein MTR_4g021280 [Medicago truncatula]